MIHKKIPFPFQGKNNATLTLYCQTPNEGQLIQSRATILVIPGGGYGSVSYREGECVALKFCSEGFNAAVLDYSVYPDALFPQSLCEAALAIAHLKQNAQAYNIDPEKIITCGFSAGGHLALSLGAFWNQKWLSERVGIKSEILRPAAQILCYPVVSSDPEIAHLKSFERILGEEPKEEYKKLVSLEHQVDENTPPTFLWSSFSDNAVPCENSLRLAAKLKEKNVPLEFHLYGWAPHGLSLADKTVQTVKNMEAKPENNYKNPHVATWFPLSIQWLDFLFDEAK